MAPEENYKQTDRQTEKQTRVEPYDLSFVKLIDEVDIEYSISP